MLITSFNPQRLPQIVRREFGNIEKWEDASQEHVAAFARFYRNLMLRESDWTQATDSPLSAAKKVEWAEYRQNLRDILAEYADDYTKIDFPQEPK